MQSATTESPSLCGGGVHGVWWCWTWIRRSTALSFQSPPCARACCLTQVLCNQRKQKMAFTRIAPLISIWWKQSQRILCWIFGVQYRLWTSGLRWRASLHAGIKLLSRMPSVPHIRPQKKHPFHSISTPPELVELRLITKVSKIHLDSFVSTN